MLIVCTTDHVIAETAEHSGSAELWGELVVLDPDTTQEEATIEMARALAGLGANEPLCFSAHGNNEEIGDADDYWGWGYDELAAMLAQAAPRFSGHILIHACATRVVNFAANLAVALEGRGALRGTWVFGYNKPLPADAGFPPPDRLFQQADLQWTEVGMQGAEPRASGVSRG